MAKVNITSPVGRIVAGSLYKPQEVDAEGRPLVYKTGTQAGQPRVNYFFALAIPKGQESHWSQTAWGQPIWAAGHAAFPQAAQSPTFAWKIEDGDSQIPNKRGRKPCDQEGFPGCWIVRLSGGFAPRIYEHRDGQFVQMLQQDAVKPGYYVEVAFSVEGNGSQSQPGIYLNHSMVCFRAFGPEIVFGPDVNEAGFGKNPLPAGATSTPPAVAAPLPLDAGAPIYPPATPAAPVTPRPEFLNVPAAPPTPAPAPAAPPHQMTAAANGIAYEDYIAAGWTDALLIQNGMMLP